MAPSVSAETTVVAGAAKPAPQPFLKEPLKLKGALDSFESFDVTPVIGKEFPKANLKEWLRAPNSDELLRDLAITGNPCPSSHGILLQHSASKFVVVLSYGTWLTPSMTVSQRGVVFFRKQDDLDNDLQKELAQRLGQLSGKPSSSGLHIHPITNSGREFAGKDDEISVISSQQQEKLYKNTFFNKKQTQRRAWHSDITFEPVPSDYAILRLTELPRTGGGK